MATFLGRQLDRLIIIQALQTVALVAVAVSVIYTMMLLRRELKGAASTLREVVASQTQLHQNVRRSWERIDALEAQLNEIAAHLRRLEDQPPRPRGPSP